MQHVLARICLGVGMGQRSCRYPGGEGVWLERVRVAQAFRRLAFVFHSVPRISDRPVTRFHSAA